jgi:hypothetical protein
MPPLMSETMFYTETEPQAKCSFYLFLIFTYLNGRREDEVFWT